jgi:hypothetical protein
MTVTSPWQAGADTEHEVELSEAELIKQLTRAMRERFEVLAPTLDTEARIRVMFNFSCYCLTAAVLKRGTVTDGMTGGEARTIIAAVRNWCAQMIERMEKQGGTTRH